VRLAALSEGQASEAWLARLADGVEKSEKQTNEDHHEMRRAVAPWFAEEVDNAAVRQDQQALQTERRTRTLPAESFESFAIPRAR
jgi:hypothetical protein